MVGQNPQEPSIQELETQLRSLFGGVIRSSEETLERFTEMSKQLHEIYKQNADNLKTQIAATMAAGQELPDYGKLIADSLETLNQEIVERNEELNTIQARLNFFQPAGSTSKQPKAVLNKNIEELNKVNEEVNKIQKELNTHAMMVGTVTPAGITQENIHMKFEKIIQPLLEQSKRLKNQMKIQKEIVEQITPEQKTSKKSGR